MRIQDAPVFIISRDRVTPLQHLVSWLEAAGQERIVIVDNASTYPPLLEYLETTHHIVERLGRNLGSRACIYQSGLLEKHLRGASFYLVSDADVVPDPSSPLDAVEYFAWALQRYPRYVKAGFGLRLDDVPDLYPHKRQVVAWERQFWTRPLGKDLYAADIATTFALHRSHVQSFVFGPSIRTGPPYLARHMPWYSTVSTPEDVYYHDHIDHKKSHWTEPDAGLNADLAPPRLTVAARLRWRAYALLKEERGGDVPRHFPGDGG